jgi:hypothetical protein
MDKINRETRRFLGNKYIDPHSRAGPELPTITGQPAEGMVPLICNNGQECCRRVKWVSAGEAGTTWNCKDENKEHAPRCTCC